MDDYNPRRDFVQCLAIAMLVCAAVIIAATVFASVMDGPLP
jgi:hypothetical protein